MDLSEAQVAGRELAVRRQCPKASPWYKNGEGVSMEFAKELLQLVEFYPVKDLKMLRRDRPGIVRLLKDVKGFKARAGMSFDGSVTFYEKNKDGSETMKEGRIVERERRIS